MSERLVRINVDPAERIADLYGIGPVLAERIVKERETRGGFDGPEDLARVAGVSGELAITLGPRIDWRRPTSRASVRLSRWPLLAVLGSTTLCTGTVALAAIYMALSGQSIAYPFLQPGALASVAGTSVVVTIVLETAGLGILWTAVFANRRPRVRRLARLGLSLLIAPLLPHLVVWLTCVALSSSMGGRWSVEVSWATLMLATPTILTVLPYALVMLRPELQDDPRLGQISEIGYAITVPALALGAWLLRRWTGLVQNQRT